MKVSYNNNNKNPILKNSKEKMKNDYNKSKAVRYFTQQKLLEISPWILGLFGFIFIPYYFMRLILFIFPLEGVGGTFPIWGMGLILLVLSLIIIALLFILIKSVYDELNFEYWIKSNWRTAKDRARIK